MSREIIYSKNFIKVGDEYIASIICGSSNCFECNNRRREHNYSFFGDNKKVLYTKDDLINLFKCDELNDSIEYHGKRINYGMRKFIENGVKNAHTIEEYVKDGVLYWKKHKYNIECLTCYVLDYKYGDSKQLLLKEIKTTDELKAWIVEAKTFINANTDKEKHYYIEIAFNRNYKYYVADRITIKQNTEQKEFNGRACLSYKRNYLTKVNSGYSFSYTKDFKHNDILIFNSFVEAKNYIINNVNEYYRQFIKIVNYDKLIKEKEKQVYYISFFKDNFKVYFKSFIKYGYQYTFRIDKLFSYANALKIAEQLKAIRNNYDFKVEKAEAVR